jgi:hypothetical protein
MALRAPAFNPDVRPHPHDNRPPWLWRASVGAALIAMTLPPMLVAAMRQPPGFQFSGYVVIARDAYVYQAIWRQGWDGAWLFRSPFTSESLPGVLLYPWYLWPAHLVGWASGPWLYHVTRVLAAAALIAALWLLVAEVFRARRLRRWAFLLAALGGGVGVVFPQLQVGPLVSHATEMQSPGSSVADLIAMAPHLSWALALLCWSFVVGLRLRSRFRLSELISGFAAVIGLQLVYPQLSLLAAIVLLGWAVIRRYRPAIWYAAGLAAIQAPYLAYLFWISRTAPDALAVIRPSLDVGDVFGFLMLSHLVASGLIVFAIWRRRIRGELWLPALWIIVMTGFMFLPGIDRVLGRSFMASSIPFGICATPGLLALARSVDSRAWRRRLVGLALAASSIYGIFVLAQPYWIAAFRLDAAAEYERSDEAALLARLAPQVSSKDIVLSSYLDGIFIPAQTSARAFAGHPEMTIDAARKAGQAEAFFRDWTVSQRAAFLRANRVDYVLASNADMAARLAGDPELSVVDRQGAMTLFKVAR